jgi:hypothetical protein
MPYGGVSFQLRGSDLIVGDAAWREMRPGVIRTVLCETIYYYLLAR